MPQCVCILVIDDAFGLVVCYSMTSRCGAYLATGSADTTAKVHHTKSTYRLAMLAFVPCGLYIYPIVCTPFIKFSSWLH
jgi:hypothetical protein